MFRKEMPACRNGRRGRLKICCGQPRAGSSPAAGSLSMALKSFYFKGFNAFSFKKSLITFDYLFKIILMPPLKLLLFLSLL